jgi:hypothetical protein
VRCLPNERAEARKKIAITFENNFSALHQRFFYRLAFSVTVKILTSVLKKNIFIYFFFSSFKSNKQEIYKIQALYYTV